MMGWAADWMAMTLWTGGGRLGVMVLALGLDQVLRDPPNAVHPAAWMGWAIGWGAARARGGRARQFATGLGIVLIGGFIAGAAGWAMQRGLGLLPVVLAWGLEALVLKLMLSMRGLARAAGMVGKALVAGDLGEARRLLAFHLVSRQTNELDERAVAAAAVESVAENTTDSVVAPLLYYLLAGLPGAVAYRFANTADAMLGYRGGAHEWLGKAPARLDDALNWIPARLTAGAMVLAAPMLGLSAVGAGRVWRTDRMVTASPNAGQPMSAAAGALGVRLNKPGDYMLGGDLRAPTAKDVGRAVRLMYASVLLLVAVTAAAFLLGSWV